MIKWYDRQGREIDTFTFGRLLEDEDYKRVARTMITSTPDLVTYDVSTIWLGLDYNWGHGAPIIFETMVFSETLGQDRPCWRYATEDEARAGHEEVVSAIAATMVDAVIIELPSPPSEQPAAGCEQQ
jgi:hypothetical protein